MARHVFSFNGGELLTTIGACWFVSYCYYEYIDKTHQNWKIVKTAANRKSVYLRTRQYHKNWLKEISKMDDRNLNRNSLKLKASQIKQMESDLLAIV
ncbi:hypothetical protein [uncultured Treponema sp.]|uniref:hypothetical protein n=1 Tax=uncultured Treponema sp. TaxID=162155 RepID=UPI002593AD1C|nr:hypothetical protein [uncultured Treponema sp.]